MELPKSGMIICDDSLCTGCGVCELICSLSHDAVTGPAMSRLQVVHNPFADSINLYACQQCESPSCYLACPLPDQALCIDKLTGARYIDEDECTGCGLCVDACSFDPPRVRLNVDKPIAFKCDLCKGRETGPACVEYCDYGALRFAPRDER